KKLRDTQNLQGLGPGHIQNARGRFTKFKRSHGVGISVSLPENIHGGNRDIDRLAFIHLARNVHQNAITKIDGVVEPEDQAGGVEFFGVELEDSLACEAGLRILPQRSWNIRLDTTAVFRRNEGIDISGRERDDPGATKMLRNLRRNDGIHGPGRVRISSRAELAAGKE